LVGVVRLNEKVASELPSRRYNQVGRQVVELKPLVLPDACRNLFATLPK